MWRPHKLVFQTLPDFLLQVRGFPPSHLGDKGGLGRLAWTICVSEGSLVGTAPHVSCCWVVPLWVTCKGGTSPLAQSWEPVHVP